MDYEKLLTELTKQEETLQFLSFSNADAMEIGLYLYAQAQKENKKVTIDISRNGQQLFHVALPGTGPDNDQWIIRKSRVVNRFSMSSYHVGTLLKSMNATLEEKFYVSSQDYAAHGGSFPIIIQNTGVIGTITVSGLPQAEDHAMVVNAISYFLKLS
jgi:uncharacterized protein (UPF0303 family)